MHDRRLIPSVCRGAIISESVPQLVAREQLMAGVLTRQEQTVLTGLLTKIILNAGAWPQKSAGRSRMTVHVNSIWRAVTSPRSLSQVRFRLKTWTHRHSRRLGFDAFAFTADRHAR